jgi:hypothetical protein
MLMEKRAVPSGTARSTPNHEVLDSQVEPQEERWRERSSRIPDHCPAYLRAPSNFAGTREGAAKNYVSQVARLQHPGLP